VLGSDHAPHTLEEKAKTYPASPSGMTGVQTLVPLMLDPRQCRAAVAARFVDLTSAGPARLYNIACKGRIAAGLRRRLHVVDLEAQRDHHQQMGGLERPAGRPMTACASPAGRSAPSCAQRVMWQGEVGDAVDRRAGAVSGDAEGVGAIASHRICDREGEASLFLRLMDCFDAAVWHRFAVSGR
jgi:hypothetical protein